jgi:hypothetical protein
MVWIGVPDIVDDCASYLDMFVAAPESGTQRRRCMSCLERVNDEKSKGSRRITRFYVWHGSGIPQSPLRLERLKEHTITIVFSGDLLRNLHKASPQQNFHSSGSQTCLPRDEAG